MSHYYKTRLYEDPFTVHKALTVPHRINQWLNKQTTFQYLPDNGFFSDQFEGVYFLPQSSDSDRLIPFTLTLLPVTASTTAIKKAQLELFYMKSHSRSDKFTDLHLFESILLGPEHDRFDAFIKTFFEVLRHHYNGDWIIKDSDLNSSRVF